MLPTAPPLRGRCGLTTRLWTVGRSGDTASHGPGALLLGKITCKKIHTAEQLRAQKQTLNNASLVPPLPFLVFAVCFAPVILQSPWVLFPSPLSNALSNDPRATYEKAITSLSSKCRLPRAFQYLKTKFVNHGQDGGGRGGDTVKSMRNQGNQTLQKLGKECKSPDESP